MEELEIQYLQALAKPKRETISHNSLLEALAFNTTRIYRYNLLDRNINYVLLDKLSSFGFNRSALQWFTSYLTNRTQSVCVNGVVSDSQTIMFGVPQGSVLGPLLFIMYINDLPHVIRFCNIELYADDTLLYFASSNVSSIETNLTTDLENVINWLHSNFLILNLRKTKIMLHEKNSSLFGYSSPTTPFVTPLSQAV